MKKKVNERIIRQFMGAHFSLLRRISDAVKGKVRYRLLVLVLFPILLIMPIALIDSTSPTPVP